MKLIVLLKAHTHAGTEYPAGAIITVHAATADYLEAHEIGKTKTINAETQRRREKNKNKP